jgi:hypothetical protein
MDTESKQFRNESHETLLIDSAKAKGEEISQAKK